MDLAAVLAKRVGRASRLDDPPVPPSWRREELWGTAEALLVHSNPTFELRVGARTVLTFHENHELIAHRVWDGACVLGFTLRRLRALGFIYRTKVVILELGAGTAASSMIAAVADDDGSGRGDASPCDWRFIATDIPAAVPHCESCVALNAMGEAVRVQALTWGDVSHAMTVRDSVARLRAALPGAPALAVPVFSGTAVHPLQSSSFLHPGGGEGPDLIIASDLAAPLSCVDPFLESLAEFMPPLPPGASASAAGSGDALSAALDAWFEDRGRGGEGPASEPGAPDTACRRPPTLSDATLQQLMPPPVLLLTCQLHREFTVALLAALRGAGYAVAALPRAGLDPAFESPRHATYVVASPPQKAATEEGCR